MSVEAIISSLIVVFGQTLAKEVIDRLRNLDIKDSQRVDDILRDLPGEAVERQLRLKVESDGS